VLLRKGDQVDEDAGPLAGALGAEAGAGELALSALPVVPFEPDAGAWPARAPPAGCASPDGFASPDDFASPDGLSAAGADLAPSRKSVTYQPDPFSWKPAAVTCFSKLSAPQAGQTVSSGSEIFWSTSFAWPQAEQR
jgi:hypothetical protein